MLFVFVSCFFSEIFPVIREVRPEGVFFVGLVGKIFWCEFLFPAGWVWIRFIGGK